MLYYIRTYIWQHLQGCRKAKIFCGGWVVMWGGGHNLTPLVEIGFTDLPKFREVGASAHPLLPVSLLGYFYASRPRIPPLGFAWVHRNVKLGKSDLFSCMPNVRLALEVIADKNKQLWAFLEIKMPTFLIRMEASVWISIMEPCLHLFSIHY